MKLRKALQTAQMGPLIKAKLQADYPPHVLRDFLWQIVILTLCVYVLGAILTDALFDLPTETSALLLQIDQIICVVFLCDFIYSLVTAPNKLQYLKWGWIDLISSIPFVQSLRWGRFFRVVRILRILYRLRSTRILFEYLLKNRAEGTFLTILLIAFFLMVFSSIAILNCENRPESNIKTASDALWWTFISITTVGYGDHYPVTPLGRVVAVVVIITGVGLLGSFTAFVVATFRKPEEEKEEKELVQILSEVSEIRMRLERIEKHLEPK
jgi:voltage-gated potassium channel